MLGVLFNIALDGVDESLRFAQVLVKESFESFAADRDVSLVLYLMQVLLLAEQGGIF